MHPIRALAIAIVAVALIAGCGTDKRSSTSPSSASDGLADIGQGLRGPANLHATTYTGGITHATAMAFDGAGRLWVATADYTDSGNDGVYIVDRAGAAPLPVITGLHTALGLAWSGDTLFVSSKERVDAYSGFDGTRFQSQHNVVTFPAGVGELNGLVLAPDGRFQLGISAPCDHCVPTSELSGAVVSFLPDGTDLRVDASRIRAPIGLAYQPGTNDLYVSMNQRDDLGDQTPGDWLSIVRTGQSWGFPNCYGQGGSVCTGVPSPVAVLDRHAAVSGVAIVTGQLGAPVGTAALVAEWQTGTVVRVPIGAGSAAPSAFLTGVKNPFGVVIGPDGALYVGDWTTGTIFRLST